MKYLKLFESVLNDTSLKIIDDFGYTEKEYLEMIEEIGKKGYSFVKNKIPFFIDMTTNNYNINSYENMRKLDIFYMKMIEERDRLDKVIDYFVDMIEDPSIDIKVETDLGTGVSNNICFVFPFDTLGDVSKMMEKIEYRLKRSGSTYKIENITKSNINTLSIRVQID